MVPAMKGMPSKAYPSLKRAPAGKAVPKVKLGMKATALLAQMEDA